MITMHVKLLLENTLHFIFALYTLMLFANILSSWVPQIRSHAFMRWVFFYTEPYLGIFRKIIPPIGGVLDISPILGFFALRFLEPFTIYLFTRFL